MGRRRWAPILAALTVVLSALIGVATNAVTQDRTITLIVTAGALVFVAAGVAWADSNGRDLVEPEPRRNVYLGS